MRIQVLGSASDGYRAEAYDGNPFVTGRGMAGVMIGLIWSLIHE